MTFFVIFQQLAGLVNNKYLFQRLSLLFERDNSNSKDKIKHDPHNYVIIKIHDEIIIFGTKIRIDSN